MMMMHVFLQSSTKKTFQVTLVSEKGLTLLSATFYKNYSDNGGLLKILDFLQIMLTCSSTTCHICLMTVVLFFSIIYIFTLMFFLFVIRFYLRYQREDFQCQPSQTILLASILGGADGQG